MEWLLTFWANMEALLTARPAFIVRASSPRLRALRRARAAAQAYAKSYPEPLAADASSSPPTATQAHQPSAAALAWTADVLPLHHDSVQKARHRLRLQSHAITVEVDRIYADGMAFARRRRRRQVTPAVLTAVAFATVAFMAVFA